MGKRSDFKRRANDDYKTHDINAVKALIPHLIFNDSFDEPCASDGTLTKHLESFGMSCMWQSDINPQAEDVIDMDAFEYMKVTSADYIITNPPWTREILHPMIDHFRKQAPTWLLFDADWKHTRQEYLAKRIGCKTVPELMEYCHKVVSVGRVKWIPDSKHTGKDNCCWYLFGKDKADTIFYGR